MTLFAATRSFLMSASSSATEAAGTAWHLTGVDVTMGSMRRPPVWGPAVWGLVGGGGVQLSLTERERLGGRAGGCGLGSSASSAGLIDGTIENVWLKKGRRLSLWFVDVFSGDCGILRYRSSLRFGELKVGLGVRVDLNLSSELFWNYDGFAIGFPLFFGTSEQVGRQQEKNRKVTCIL